MFQLLSSSASVSNYCLSRFINTGFLLFGNSTLNNVKITNILIPYLFKSLLWICEKAWVHCNQLKNTMHKTKNHKDLKLKFNTYSWHISNFLPKCKVWNLFKTLCLGNKSLIQKSKYQICSKQRNKSEKSKGIISDY